MRAATARALALALFVLVGVAGSALHPLSLPSYGQLGPVYWDFEPSAGYADIWIDWSAD